MSGGDAVDALTARCRQIPLSVLADALGMLEAKPRLTPGERQVRAVIIDVICERCPAADMAFTVWSEGSDPYGAAAAITGAVRAAMAAMN